MRQAGGYGETELDRAAGLLAIRDAAAVIEESAAAFAKRYVVKRGEVMAHAASSPRHSIQAPCLGVEFCGGFSDSGASVWGFDSAEPDDLGGNLVNGPDFWLWRFRFAWHAASIGRKVSRFNGMMKWGWAVHSAHAA